MIVIKASVKLFKSAFDRQNSFETGYRPMFSFIEDMRTSGRIRLLDREKLYPGYEAIVEIDFPNSNFFGDDFKIGSRFRFGESTQDLGEGSVIDIVE